MRSANASIDIDGAHGEGGGALLRMALSMSALTQQPVRITNVRGATRFPGLDAEDIAMISALARSCRAETQGAELKSPSVYFSPTRRPAGISGAIEMVRNEQGRGPNALVVLNSLLPILARTGVYNTVSAQGETYGLHSLSFDYFANVTLSALRKMGIYAYADQVRAGFGRESNGEVELNVEPSAIEGLEWADRGSLLSVHAVVTTCHASSALGERGVEHLNRLAQTAGLPMLAERQDASGKSPGAHVTVWARYERGMGGGAAMGTRGTKIETLAQAAFDETSEWMATSSTVDPFLADQLLLPAVLAEGETTLRTSRLTLRFLTSIWVIKQFTPIHITVRGSENGPGVVSVRR